jgi:bloom syndrome protein
MQPISSSVIDVSRDSCVSAGISDYLTVCWFCQAPYRESGPRRQSILNPCGHLICYECLGKHDSSNCKACFGDKSNTSSSSRFKTYNNDIILVNESLLAPVQWNFQQIKSSFPEFQVSKPACDNLIEIVLTKFGHKGLREGQKPIIYAALMNRHILVMLKAGAGKSLLFQLPALVGHRVTIVVSPLTALIHDQVKYLHLKNFQLEARHLYDGRDSTKEIIKDLKRHVPVTRLLYLTPEAMQSERMIPILKDLHQRQMLERVVFDEAHCIILWGHDFRAKYLNMKNLVQRLLTKVPVTMLTASVAPEMMQHVIAYSGVDPSSPDICYFYGDLNRANLQYSVEMRPKNEMRKIVIEIVQSSVLSHESGIVYCNSRLECDELADYLNKQNISSVVYHADKNEDEKDAAFKAWTNGEARIVVATIAFGMGIDKSNVRFVIHCGLPKSMEGYYQESGRAGRDGRKAICKLLFANNDYISWDRSIKESKDYSSAMSSDEIKFVTQRLQSLEAIHAYARNKVTCRRKLICQYFGQKYDEFDCFKNFETSCDVCQSNQIFDS